MRKVGREQCERKWRSKGCDDIADRIMASLRAHIASEAWRKDDGAFIPQPLTWLNQARWEAETVAPPEAKASAAAAETARYLEAQDAHKREAPPPEVAAKLAQLTGRLKVV